MAAIRLVGRVIKGGDLEYAISNGQMAIIIGRGKEGVDVTVPNRKYRDHILANAGVLNCAKTISEKHCTIRYDKENSKFYLRDGVAGNASKFKTYVNGVVVSTETEINSGDKLRLGGWTYGFQVVEGIDVAGETDVDLQPVEESPEQVEAGIRVEVGDD